MKRRQQMLPEAGQPAQRHRVQPAPGRVGRRRQAGPRPLPPLPNLLVVIDEFGELLTAKPDFIELFLAIGRIGRSIGVHLLLASQRLEEGRLRGLESFLSYRLGLRTFNGQESRVGARRPRRLRAAADPRVRLPQGRHQRSSSGSRPAYVSGTYRPPVTGETVIDADPVVAPFPLVQRHRRLPGRDADGRAGWTGRAGRTPSRRRRGRARPTVLDVVGPAGWRRPDPHRTRSGCRRCRRASTWTRSPARCAPTTCAAWLPTALVAGCGCRSACSTSRPSSGRSRWCSTSPASAVTWSCSAPRSRASRRCCAPSSCPRR